MVQFESQSNDLGAAKSPAVILPVIEMTPSDFIGGENYVNRTQRYVIRIGELSQGGEPLIYPEGSAKAGQPIKAQENGQPERGIVFWNSADSVWQAARGNGKESILITGVDANNAHLLAACETELLSGSELHSIETAKALLQIASDLGLNDRQNKKNDSIEKEMAPIPGGSPNHQVVTKPDFHKVVYIPTGFIFKDGPVEQTYPEGAVLITNGRHVWGVDKNVFIKNFKRVEGKVEIDLVSLDDEFPS